MVTEYENNSEFREYVDKYCKSMGVSINDAFTHKMVALYLQYLRER